MARSRIVVLPCVLLLVLLWFVPAHPARAGTAIGSMTASIGCGPIDAADDCYVDASFNSSSISVTTDYYGSADIDVSLSWAWSPYWNWNEDFDATFKIYVDNVLGANTTKSCSAKCAPPSTTGTLTATVTSPNGTTQRTIGLDVDCDSDDCGGCSTTNSQTISVVRPSCPTSISLNSLGDVDQNCTSVTISGNVVDTGCGSSFSDNSSVQVIVKAPSGATLLNTWVNLSSGAFTTSCTMPPKDDTASYGLYVVTADYSWNAPTGHDRADTPGGGTTGTFSRKWNIRTPSPPRSADSYPVLISDRIAFADIDTEHIYLYEYGIETFFHTINVDPFIEGAMRGIAAYPFGGGLLPQESFVVSQGGTNWLLFVDMEGNPILDVPAPVADPFGLDHDGEALWVADHTTGELVRFLPENGMILNWINPGLGGLSDIAWDPLPGEWGQPTLLVLTEGGPGEARVYRVEPNSGAVMQSYPIELTGIHYCSAMDVVNGTILLADFETWDVFPFNQGAPAPPATLFACSSPVTPDRIALTWTDPDAEPPWERILVYRDGDLVQSVGPGEQQFLDTGLEEHSWHDYTLVAVHDGYETRSEPSVAAGCFVGCRPPRTVHVPEDYATVQWALAQSMDDDEILVGPGTYRAPVDFGGRNVAVRSTGGPAVTFLDGEGSSLSLATFYAAEDERAVLEGFTLRGGDLRHGTGAVHVCPSAMPAILGNVIAGDTLWYEGGGIVCDGGGGGGGGARIEGNTIARNPAHPDSLGQFRGGGIYCRGAGSPIVRGNIIASNDSCGYAIYCEGGASPEIDCNDNWDSFLGATFGCSPGPNDIAEDPLFCDAAGLDFSLCADSPCLDVPGCGRGRIGALGEGCEACGSGLDFADHDVGDCVLTMTERGILGFLDEAHSAGSGFVYAPAGQENLLYVGSLWVGQSPAYVANRDYESDPAKEWTVSTSPNGHLTLDQSGYADQVIRGSYTDAAASQPRGLFVGQESWAFAVPEPADDFVIVHYAIENRGTTTLSGLYTGVFLDLDVGAAYDQNTGMAEATRDMVYMRDAAGTHAAVRLLRLPGDAPARNLTLVHNPTFVWPNMYILDADKYAFLSAADPAHVLTDGSAPDDYGLVVSAGPFTLAPGEEKLLAFAILGGRGLAELREHADAALLVHREGITDAPEGLAAPSSHRLLAPEPNPFRGTTQVRFELARPEDVRLSVYDIGGRLVRTLLLERLLAGPHVLSWDGRTDRGSLARGGIYFIHWTAGDARQTRRVVLLP